MSFGGASWIGNWGKSGNSPSPNGGLPESYLNAFVGKYPIARQSWTEAVAAGDKRDFGQWLQGHAAAFPQSDYARELNAFQANPVDATNALTNYKTEQAKAAADKLASDPDWDEYLARPEVAAYWQKVQDVGVEKFADKYDFAQSYYHNIGQPNGHTLKTKGQTGNLAADGKATTVSAEQAFYNKAVNDYVLPDLEADRKRQEEAAKLKAQYQSSFDATNKTITDLTTMGDNGGSKLYDQELVQFDKAADAHQTALNDEVAAKNESLLKQLESYKGNLTTYTDAERVALAKELADKGVAIDQLDATQKEALSTQLTKLHQAQDPLNAERINAAKQQMTGINLGLQSTQDNIAAQTAMDGYAGGGSSATNMAMSRAAIEARQGAAAVMGQAKVANATDNRDIDQYGAKQEYSNTTGIADKRFGLANYGAEGTRGITGTLNKGLYDLGNYGADQTRGIADYGAAGTKSIADDRATGKFGLFTGDVQRRLSALSLPTQALQQQLNTNRMLDEYGQTGLNRGLGTLGYFNTSGVSNPYSNGYGNQANTALGTTYSNLGAGLMNFGGTIAMDKWLNSKPGSGSGTGTTGTGTNTTGSTWDWSKVQNTGSGGGG